MNGNFAKKTASSSVIPKCAKVPIQYSRYVSYRTEASALGNVANIHFP